jgi:thiamine-monophosphate kinase
LAVSLSDIAAMGGNPKYFNISIGIPLRISVEFIEALYNGIIDISKAYNVSLVGGDISKSKDKLIIDISLIGEGENVIFRNGAGVGDQIFVTGNLGDSAFGLNILKNCYKIKNERFINKHLEPCPRVREGMILSKLNLPTSMIDISDGLIKDLGHIIKESDVGAIIWMEKLPFSEEMLEVIDIEEVWNLALTGGEDYELLFTVKKDRIGELVNISKKYNMKISHIGEIKKDKKDIKFLVKDGRVYNPKGYGYDHFRD